MISALLVFCFIYSNLYDLDSLMNVLGWLILVLSIVLFLCILKLHDLEQKIKHLTYVTYKSSDVYEEEKEAYTAYHLEQLRQHPRYLACLAKHNLINPFQDLSPANETQNTDLSVTEISNQYNLSFRTITNSNTIRSDDGVVYQP